MDTLVFPRFVLPFGAGAILTMETNADEIWKYSDTNGDGVADRRELFMAGFGRAGTMEIQPSSLFWAMDNWLYSTVNAYRLRWTPHGLLREPTAPNGAQWGISQDNHGKLYFQGGSSGLPGYFQFPNDVDARSDRVLVADKENNRVQVIQWPGLSGSPDK